MSNCPYCTDTRRTVVETERTRHPMHTTVVCDTCHDYYVVHRNGRAYPLVNRADKNSDAVLRA